MKNNIMPETIGIFIAFCGAAVAVIGWGFDIDVFKTQMGLEYFLVTDKTTSPENLFAGRPAVPTMICFILIALSGIYFLFCSKGRGFCGHQGTSAPIR